jgi:hypothetical protein
MLGLKEDAILGWIGKGRMRAVFWQTRGTCSGISTSASIRSARTRLLASDRACTVLAVALNTLNQPRTDPVSWLDPAGNGT